MSRETRAALFGVVVNVVELLRSGRFEEVERLSNGTRFSADQLRGAVNAYPYRLVGLPEDADALMDVVPVAGHPSQWSVIQPLFTAQEGRSDLSLVLTITRERATFLVEVDDIHVL